jgi:hypothetical protein
MRVYRIELMILDFDEIGEEEIKRVLEDTRYPNRCISPEVMEIESHDIGEWNDQNPLNYKSKSKEAFNLIFKTGVGF